MQKSLAFVLKQEKEASKDARLLTKLAQLRKNATINKAKISKVRKSFVKSQDSYYKQANRLSELKQKNLFQDALKIKLQRRFEMYKDIEQKLQVAKSRNKALRAKLLLVKTKSSTTRAKAQEFRQLSKANFAMRV